jgi:uncharacterized membrane protein YfcA
MPDPVGWAVLLGGAVLGSVVGGVAGFGAGLILLPLLVWALGVRAAAPVLTITMLIGNLSRIWWSRRDVHPGVALRFLVGAIPATALGVMFYAGAPGDSVRWIMGAFLIVSVPLRRWLLTRNVTVRLRHFPLVGSLVGVLSGIVVATGPVASPFFLAYGLRRGAYIGTESVCALGMHVARGLAFAGFALITWETVAIGAALGAVTFVGAWLGRGLLDRMSDRTFLTILEVFLVLMGLQFLLVSR